MRSRSLASLIVLLFLMATVISWIASTNFGPFTLLYLRSFGILFASLGLTMVFLQFLFVSRIRFIEASAGLDRLLQMHRFFGRAGLVLLFGHALLIAFYRLIVFGDIYSNAFILIGAVALLGFMVTGALASQHKKIGLAYEIWRNIHLANYILFPLVLIHVFYHSAPGSLLQYLFIFITLIYLAVIIYRLVRIINKKQTGEFLKKVGINEKKLKYIPASYIDLEVFRSQNLEKKYDIVFSGRLVKNKGIFLLLKAVSSIKYQVSSIKLAIVGSGPLKNKIKKYIKKNRLEQNIEFIGWVPTVQDLAKIYNQSKIMVIPSFNEGGPRVCLEAMACKIPVITSKVGVMLDIINPSTNSGQENGLFIDWNPKDIREKIDLLLKDKELYKKIAENGYQTVQQFERKKVIKNYATKYQNLLHSS